MWCIQVWIKITIIIKGLVYGSENHACIYECIVFYKMYVCIVYTECMHAYYVFV